MSDTPISSHDHGNCELCDQIERELSASQSRVRKLEGNADKAIWALVKLNCQCLYDMGAPGKPAVLLGPLCHRCAAIKLLSPKVALQDAALAEQGGWE